MNTAHRLALTPSRRAALRRYGLDEADLATLLEAQNYCCAICRRPFSPSRPPCVDHDHRTGAVRGLLCRRCNRDLLGIFGDDPTLFTRAADYLRHPPAAALPGPPRRAPNSAPATRE